ncbi:MAG: hypothetical protein IPM54_29820 [Polyangiaceae bacterium]|nr:hypothetical protein [Polyangiaceae bacterium]
MNFSSKHIGAAFLTAILIASCSGENSGHSSSGGNPAPAEFDVAPSISECGGFINSGAKIPMPDAATYCDAERLLWNYDAATKTLGLTNARIMLNCCGDHSVNVTRDGDTLVFTEVDAPEAAAGGARCHCMCVFDYAADIIPVESGSISIRVVRDVTDAPPSKIAWEGTIDTSAGEGEVIINSESAEPWCMK